MANEDILGAVRILITGDSSQLDATFSATQAAARRYGATIAGEFTAAMEPMKSANAEAIRLSQSIGNVGAAASAGAPKMLALAGATREVAAAHGAAVSQIQATSGALRVLEGSQGIRAAERFIASTLGIGPALQAIFPVVGALAFGEILVHVGEKVYELYATVRDAKEKIGGEFRDMALGVESANDELQVSADKAHNLVLQLQGLPKSLLAQSIHETTVETDALGKSLNAALDSLYKIQKENEIGAIGGFITRRESTSQSKLSIGGNTGLGGFRAEESKEIEREAQAFRTATTEAQRLAIQTELNRNLAGIYAAEIRNQEAELRRLTGTSNNLRDSYASAAWQALLSPFRAFIPAARDASAAIESVKRNLEVLRTGQGTISLTDSKITDSRKAEDIEASRKAAAEAAKVPEARLQAQSAANSRFRQITLESAESQIAIERQAAAARIALIENVHERELAIASLDVVTAQRKADAIKGIIGAFQPSQLAGIAREGALSGAGRDPIGVQQAQIETQAKLAALRANNAKEVQKAEEEAAAASAKAWTTAEEVKRKQADESAKQIEKIQGDLLKASLDDITRELNEQKKILESKARGAGDVAAAAAERERIQLQARYAASVDHTGAQQVENARALASLDQQRRDVELAALATRIQIASKDHDGAESARLQAEYDKQAADNANKTLAAKLQLAQVERQLTLQYQLQAALSKGANQIPGALGGALAAGIVGGNKGENIGTQIANALKNVGKDILGNVLTAAIKELITTLGLNTVAQTVSHVLFGTQTAAEAANTAALVANTAALLAAGTSQFAALGGFIGALGFAADGGRIGAGSPFVVGERGPELFIPDAAGQIIPAGQFGKGVMGFPAVSGVSSSSSTAVGQMHFHAHGVTNPKEFIRQVARELPAFLKSTGPQFSPAGS